MPHQPPPRRLGRGLSALLSITELPGHETPVPSPATPAEPTPAASNTLILKVSQLRPNPRQPRQELPADHLQALAGSIAKTGLIQPIAVRPAAAGTYEIIAGERRWRAAQMAGLAEIPAIVREATDEQMLEMALVENIYREDLNAIDRAAAYKRYCDEFKISSEEVAKRLGEDRSTVTNYLRLLELPSEVKRMVINGQLAMGHARCLLALRTPADIIKVAQQCLAEELSVRAVEKIVQDKLAARSAATSHQGSTTAEKRPLIRELEETFIRALGTKVEINESRRKGKGKLIIHYRTLEDFDRICERLRIPTGEM
ncbi:MAG TPA: ParB/RepB/Spo0J family partition protein [Phycisphaerae bacterium]|nr:ParB/RepB/Spo0J family partition protein [Phycisphaerae bacterium]HRY67543.1 ParB/RepB/Spo0J family partition protein [Phycisphaerae bacterium]HSA24930.1 ParB/RepB/Spo0J family partition protein [Phycisphaerae bacterium]